jgi:signal transduction histidine kinase
MEMSVDYKRVVFTLARRQLPRGLRNNENFYFFMFCVSSVFFLFLLTPFFLCIHQLRPAWSSALAGVLITLVLGLWHKGTPLVWCQIGYQSTLIWLIVFNSYYTGGVASPTLVWLGIVPILPLFTAPRSWCYFWLFISFASVGIIYVGQRYELIPILHNESPEELALAASMIGLLSITQLVLVSTYDTTRGQHMRLMRRQNDKLIELSDDLQQAGKYKDRFLNTVSHEMRTPLNAVNGYLGLLAKHDSGLVWIASYFDKDFLSTAQGQSVNNIERLRRKNAIFNRPCSCLNLAGRQTHVAVSPSLQRRKVLAVQKHRDHAGLGALLNA